MAGNGNQLRDDGAILEGSQIVADTKVELLGEVQNLKGKIDGWLGSQWQGQGATSYQSLQEAWNQKVTELFNSLDNFVENLKSTSSSIEQREADTAQSMQGLLGSAGL